MTNIDMALITAGCNPVIVMHVGKLCATPECKNRLGTDAIEQQHFCSYCSWHRKREQSKTGMARMRAKREAARVAA